MGGQGGGRSTLQGGYRPRCVAAKDGGHGVFVHKDGGLEGVRGRLNFSSMSAGGDSDSQAGRPMRSQSLPTSTGAGALSLRSQMRDNQNARQQSQRNITGRRMEIVAAYVHGFQAALQRYQRAGPHVVNEAGGSAGASRRGRSHFRPRWDMPPRTRSMDRGIHDLDLTPSVWEERQHRNTRSLNFSRGMIDNGKGQRLRSMPSEYSSSTTAGANTGSMPSSSSSSAFPSSSENESQRAAPILMALQRRPAVRQQVLPVQQNQALLVLQLGNRTREEPSSGGEHRLRVEHGEERTGGGSGDGRRNHGGMVRDMLGPMGWNERMQRMTYTRKRSRDGFSDEDTQRPGKRVRGVSRYHQPIGNQGTSLEPNANHFVNRMMVFQTHYDDESDSETEMYVPRKKEHAWFNDSDSEE